MSRTWKDKPFWVKTNDDDCFVFHNHHHFGKVFKKSFVVLDSEGAPVIERVIETHKQFEVSFDYKGGFFGFYKTVERVVERFVYTKRVVHVVPNVCTADWRLPHGGKVNGLPVSIALPCYRQPKIKEKRFSKSGQYFARKTHARHRNRVNRNALVMKKQWNSDKNIDFWDSVDAYEDIIDSKCY